MKRKCLKCDYEGEFHKVSRFGIPFVIIQCPKCCFIVDIMRVGEVRIIEAKED